MRTKPSKERSDEFHYLHHLHARRSSQVPKGLGDEVKTAFKYYMGKKSVFGERDLVMDLPSSIRTQLVKAAYEVDIQKLTYLKNEVRHCETKPSKERSDELEVRYFATARSEAKSTKNIKNILN